MTTLPFCLPPDFSAETFLTDYWQKKPLLIKNGLPQLVGMFEPDDILELATFEEVTARLITQAGKHSKQWTLRNSPFSQKDFAKLPELWTILVQNMEQWSPELATLWHAFAFIPQWQQDDIMVSYAPKGGSVGRHFDEYDVFLAQGYGSRRWQLGQMCDENTEFLAGQPIRLISPDSKNWGEVIFDEILEAGDVLYVPPRLSHYGVAQDDCLTFSFGFRRPNLVQILDNLADVSTQQDSLNTPLCLKQTLQNAGKLDNSTVLQIKQTLLDLLNSVQGETLVAQAVAETVSKRQYDMLASEEIYSEEGLLEHLQNGASISQDFASRMLYFANPLQLYINGSLLNSTENPNEVSQNELTLLARLADGETLTLVELEDNAIAITTLMDWLENGWVVLNEAL